MENARWHHPHSEGYRYVLPPFKLSTFIYHLVLASDTETVTEEFDSSDNFYVQNFFNT
jgi:hypothetical protein